MRDVLDSLVAYALSIYANRYHQLRRFLYYLIVCRASINQRGSKNDDDITSIFLVSDYGGRSKYLQQCNVRTRSSIRESEKSGMENIRIVCVNTIDGFIHLFHIEIGFWNVEQIKHRHSTIELHCDFCSDAFQCACLTFHAHSRLYRADGSNNWLLFESIQGD